MVGRGGVGVDTAGGGRGRRQQDQKETFFFFPSRLCASSRPLLCKLRCKQRPLEDFFLWGEERGRGG